MHGPLLAVLLTATSATSGGLALCPLVSRGVAPEAMQQLDAALRIELSRAGVASVGSGQPCRDAARRPCGIDPVCLRDFARSAGASEVLFGEVHAHPDSFAVTLRLLDVASGEETASTASVNRDVEEMVWATRAQVTRLKAPEKYAGRLEFEVPAAAELFVAGRRLEEERALILPPGSYAVRVAHSGRELESWVEVRFEQSAKVRTAQGGSALEVGYAPWAVEKRAEPVAFVPGPQPEPALAGSSKVDERQTVRWPAWAALGAGAALLAAGIVQQVRADSFRGDIEALRGPSGNFPAGSAEQVRGLEQSASTAQLSGWLLVGTGLAAGLGGGAYLILLPSDQGPRAEMGLATRF